ncbi:MAG: twin-arginine translocation signal domain-containing protein [Anaerolineae bacterium]|nr:twin-arginine translocation signal domain-containing protein [Anaerolineae bacterium]
MSDPKGFPNQISRRSFLRGGLGVGIGALLGAYIPNQRLLALQEKVELQFWHQFGGPP